VITDHHREEDVAILGGLSDHYVVKGSPWKKKSLVITISMGWRVAVLSE
jgi:hypothetical protein